MWSFKISSIENVLCLYRFLIVSKCEAVSPALVSEYKAEVKTEDSGNSLKRKAMDVDDGVKTESAGVVLKLKQEVTTKSAAQIVHDQQGK